MCDVGVVVSAGGQGVDAYRETTGHSSKTQWKSHQRDSSVFPGNEAFNNGHIEGYFWSLCKTLYSLVCLGLPESMASSQ